MINPSAQIRSSKLHCIIFWHSSLTKPSSQCCCTCKNILITSKSSPATHQTSLYTDSVSMTHWTSYHWWTYHSKLLLSTSNLSWRDRTDHYLHQCHHQSLLWHKAHTADFKVNDISVIVLQLHHIRSDKSQAIELMSWTISHS